MVDTLDHSSKLGVRRCETIRDIYTVWQRGEDTQGELINTTAKVLLARLCVMKKSVHIVDNIFLWN